MVQTFKTVILLAILSSSATYATDCSMDSICKISISGPDIPDRKSKGGQIIKGGIRAESAADSGCGGGMCEWEDVRRKKRLLEDVKKRFAKIILNGRNPGTITRSDKNFLDAIESTTFVNVLENSSVGVLCRIECRAGESDISNAKTPSSRKSYGICICPKMEKYPDEFLIFAIAHELCHSDDICGPSSLLKTGRHILETTYGGESVVSCLEKNGFTSKLLENDKHFCDAYSQHAQEASCDVLGVQVLADFLKDNPFNRPHPDNFLRILGSFHELGCEKKDSNPGRKHPTDYRRMERILLANPTIRSALSCEGNSKYNSCDYLPTFTSHRNKAIRVIE